MACGDMKDMDLEPWRETKTCEVRGVKIDLHDTKFVSPCLSCTCTSEGVRPSDPICLRNSSKRRFT